MASDESLRKIEREMDIHKAALDTLLPFGPYEGFPIAEVPVEHLVELLSEPFVSVVDPQGEPAQVPAEKLSPFGGAMGKIRRCQCFAVVCDWVKLNDPETYDGLLGDPEVDALADPEAAAKSKQSKSRSRKGKAT